jgi:hypothetical protein
MRSGRTFGALLCNGRLKLKNYGAPSIIRYTCLIKGLTSFARSEIFPAKARDLHETRTSLVKAEMSKTHLEQRVEELSRKQQGDAERLAVYERRPSAVSGATHHVSAEGGAREHQLEAEVADLWYALCEAILCVTYSRFLLVLR